MNNYEKRSNINVLGLGPCRMGLRAAAPALSVPLRAF